MANFDNSVERKQNLCRTFLRKFVGADGKRELALCR